MELRSMSNLSQAPARTSSLRRHEALMAWLFSAPALFFLIVFLAIPFIMAIALAFTDQRLVPNPNLPTRFVGLRNFIRLAEDETFHRAILNNFYFVIVVVPIQTALALFLAVLVNQKIRAANLFRTIYFSPVVITMVVVSVIWFFLYNPGEGLINKFIEAASFGHLGPYNWLNDPKLAFPAIMVLSIWQGVGFQMVIFLAGLQEIPSVLYEAAEMDGASKRQQFFYVTLPQLRNTTIFVVLATTILAFKLFTQVWVMQGPSGHPLGSTMTTMVYVVSQGFKLGKIGYSSAIAVVFFLIVLAVSLLQRIFLREERVVE
ncbi:MAG: sugar ABC transporter permease [Chloroflexi bacterium]|nr:sugar ABC transporter permease [Chloroflexota bacterium]